MSRFYAIFFTCLLASPLWAGPSEQELAAQIDRLILEHLVRESVQPASLAEDDDFLRRVYLDLEGVLPSPQEVAEFRQNTSADKRAQVIEKLLASDGYATGLVIFVARQAELPASDARLQRGIAWLKTHQRESGRWFTPSQAWHTRHLIANAGTAYAVMALAACDER